MKSQSSNALQASSNCSTEKATARAKLLLGCYRKGSAEDEETYVAAVIAVLSDYPEAIAARVTDPRTGLPGQVKWLPTVAEVREACEKVMEPVRAFERRERERKESRRHLAAAERPSLERRKALADEMRARFADFGKEDRPKSFATMTPGEAEARLNDPEFLAAMRAPLTVSTKVREQFASGNPNREQPQPDDNQDF